MATKRFGGATVVLRETVFVVGGQNTIPLSAVDKAPLFPDGSLGVWSKDTPLQENRVGGGLVAGKDVLYLIGGYNGKKYLKEVQRAYFVPGKSLGAWVNDPKLIADLSEFDKKLHTDARNHFNLGLQRYMEKRYDNAIIEFKLGIEVNKEYAQLYNFLGLAYQAKESNDEAVLQFSKAVELSPTLVPAYFNLGNVYLEMGMVKKSEEMYRKSIELEPKFIDAKIKYIQLLADTGRCAEAKPKIESLGETLPQHPAIQELNKSCDFLFNQN
jgi:tetratricopeptide (TPR) repeat protein